MSINGAGYLALSGMLATQVQMSVASANISNAGTAGYTEKTANQVAIYNGNAGAGTSIASITGSIDKFMLKSLVGATSDLGAADTTNNYLNQLQTLYGDSSGSNGTGTSLGNTLAALEAAVSSLASSPNSASLQAAAVSALDDVTSQLRTTSEGIQHLRGDADQDIASEVDDVNKQLTLIGSLNLQIQQAAATGQPTGDLEDQRNTALQDIASKMDVSYFTSSNGSLQIYTTGGQALVDSTVHQLAFSPAVTVNTATSYSATPPSGLSGITVGGVDVTGQINSGSIGALIDLRDTVLPGAQSQLDELSSKLISTLNAVHNEGTASPAPSQLTGSATVTSATALAATGTARIAVVDASGALVSYQDLDLSSYSTVGSLVSAINGISGLSASIDGDGHVVIASTNSADGVAINEMTSSVGSGGEGLSDWLGLNDLLTGTDASNIAVRSDIVANPSLLAVGTLDSSVSLTAGAQVLSPGSSTTLNNFYNALTGQTTFAAAGGLGSTEESFANYAADVVSNVAAKASNASSDYTSKQAIQSSFSSTMSSQSGVNLDQETARLSTLQNEYQASAELLQVLNQMFSALLTAVQTSVA